MKKGILLGVIIGVIVMTAGFAIPAFAHGPDDDTATPPTDVTTPLTNDDAWQKMYNACGTGDWEAMADAAREFHEDGYGHMMPWHGITGDNEDTNDWWNGMHGYTGDGTTGGWGGHMGGGMMGW